MPSVFDLNIAVSALRAHQWAMSVTGQNIANANTEGYTRQEAVFVAGRPINTGSGTTGIPQLGTGVLVETVRRMQSGFTDNQLRLASNEYGMWSSRSQTLQQIEPLLNEPGDSGLSSLMDKFWNSWGDLSSTPESLPARVAVVENGSALADRIRTLYQNLRDLQSEANRAIVSRCEDINRIGHQIADLNTQIQRLTSDNSQPNDLLDQRDLLIEQLSKLVRIEVHGAAGPDAIISIGGKAFVQGDHVSEIEVTPGAGGWSQLTWVNDGAAVYLPGGELKGLLDVRDTLIEGYIGSLNEIANTVITQVNALHITGTDLKGQPAGGFFTGAGAADIRVDSSLMLDPSKVAASGNGSQGDNAVSNAIEAIKDQVLINGQTISGAYSSLVARIGSNTREAKTRSDISDISVKQLKTQRDSISGVSLDEEMANMVKFQQGYNAAARIFTVIDEMMDTLINRTGV